MTGQKSHCGQVLKGVPLISNPEAAVQALVEFFESRQMLMRDDFLRVLSKSQLAK